MALDLDALLPDDIIEIAERAAILSPENPGTWEARSKAWVELATAAVRKELDRAMGEAFATWEMTGTGEPGEFDLILKNLLLPALSDVDPGAFAHYLSGHPWTADLVADAAHAAQVLYVNAILEKRPQVMTAIVGNRPVKAGQQPADAEKATPGGATDGKPGGTPPKQQDSRRDQIAEAFRLVGQGAATDDIEMARVIGVSPASVRNWLAGRSRPVSLKPEAAAQLATMVTAQVELLSAARDLFLALSAP